MHSSSNLSLLDGCVGDIRRLLGGGSALGVGQAFDRLWKSDDASKRCGAAIDSIGRREGEAICVS
jgi:hypothetical protein